MQEAAEHDLGKPQELGAAGACRELNCRGQRARGCLCLPGGTRPPGRAVLFPGADRAVAAGGTCPPTRPCPSARGPRGQGEETDSVWAAVRPWTWPGSGAGPGRLPVSLLACLDSGRKFSAAVLGSSGKWRGVRHSGHCRHSPCACLLWAHLESSPAASSGRDLAVQALSSPSRTRVAARPLCNAGPQRLPTSCASRY